MSRVSVKNGFRILPKARIPSGYRKQGTGAYVTAAEIHCPLCSTMLLPQGVWHVSRRRKVWAAHCRSQHTRLPYIAHVRPGEREQAA